MPNVCVIGAGPSGLASARRLIALGAGVTVFERGTASGGTWIYDDRTVEDAPLSEDEQRVRFHAPPGGCYDSLTTNIVTPLMRFHNYDYPSGTDWFVTRKPVLDYIQSFSKDADLEKLIRYDTAVVNIKKRSVSGQWRVRIRRLVRQTSDEKEKAGPQFQFEDLTFDAVVVGTGHYDLEHIPFLPGLPDLFERSPSTISHSKSYRTPEPYRGLTVLVIGSGTSAFEIAKDACLAARQVYLARRLNAKASGVEKLVEDTIWSIIPPQLSLEAEVEAFLGGDGHDAEDGVFDAQPATATVKLIDGKVLKGIDKVIFCTGYRYTLPFLQDDFHPLVEQYPILCPPSPSLTLPYRLHSVPAVPEEGPPSYSAQLQNLHQDIFYLPDPTLSFVGLPIKIRAIPFFDIQALVVASVLTGHAKLPSLPSLELQYRNRIEEQGAGKRFHVLGKKKEVQAVHATLKWLADQGIALDGKEDYTPLMKEGDGQVVEVTRQFLMARTRFKGVSEGEIRAVVEHAVEQLRQNIEDINAEARTADKEGA